MSEAHGGDKAGGERIAKAMARAGLCSRRDAEQWILDGRVKVNGVKLASITAQGALVGEMSVLLGTESTATVKAEKATTVRVVADALAYLERQPLVALRVAMLLSQRLDATSALLVELSKSNPQKSPE